MNLIVTELNQILIFELTCLPTKSTRFVQCHDCAAVDLLLQDERGEEEDEGGTDTDFADLPHHPIRMDSDSDLSEKSAASGRPTNGYLSPPPPPWWHTYAYPLGAFALPVISRFCRSEYCH